MINSILLPCPPADLETGRPRLHVQFDDGGCTRLFEVYSALHGALCLTGKGTACRARGGG